MLNILSGHRNQASTKHVAAVTAYLGADTAVVMEKIIGITQYGWVKAYGGIWWRAVTTDNDLVLLPKQRVRVLALAENLLVVEPIGPVQLVRKEPAAQPHPNWAQQYQKNKAA